MKKKFLLSFILICLGILALGITASADTYDKLTFELKGEEITITDCKNASGELIIPSKIYNFPVTSIGERAFSQCSLLTSISIPDTVTSIGDYAFYYCTGLKSVNIPDSVTSIGFCAFQYCTKLSSITIPGSVTYMDYRVFEYCESLTNVIIEDGVPLINHIAFSGCKNLSSITIPDSVTFIGANAFTGCTNLKNITIPDSVTFIDDNAFWWSGLASINIPSCINSINTGTFLNCKNLSSINIPDNITTIEDSAFNSCTNLKTLTIPDSVTSIGDNAFNNCKALANAYYYGTPEEWALVNIGTNNEYLTKNIIFVKYIRANKSDDGKIIIEPVNIESGKTVVLALYNGDILSEIIPVTYTGELISLTPTKDYTSAKVMVWEDLFSMKPVCEAVEL